MNVFQWIKGQLSDCKYIEFTIGEAIFLGLALRATTSYSSIIPLIDWHTDFFREVAPVGLLLLLFSCILFGRRLVNWATFTVIVYGIISFIYKYSRIKAFMPVSIVVGLYLFLVKSFSPSQKKISAQICLSLIFIISAAQKLNAEFLAGEEFLTETSTLLVHLVGTFPQLSSIDSLVQGTQLPLLSVFLEFALGLLFLVSPAWASLLSLSFILVLCAINPFVNYVFLLMAPLYLDANPQLQTNLEKSFLNRFLKSPFFWIAFYEVWNSLPYFSAIGYFLLVLPFLLLTLAYTVRLHLPLITTIFDIFKDSQAKNWKLLGPPVIVVFYYLGNIFFLPSPTGFSMFASQEFRHGWHAIIIESRRGCFWLKEKPSILNVSDVRLNVFSKSSCRLKTATAGGVTFALRKICERDIESKFSYSQSKDPDEKTLTCSNRSLDVY